jgi:hypothetical protein
MQRHSRATLSLAVSLVAFIIGNKFTARQCNLAYNSVFTNTITDLDVQIRTQLAAFGTFLSTMFFHVMMNSVRS